MTFNMFTALNGGRVRTLTGKEVFDLTILPSAIDKFKLVGTVDGLIYAWDGEGKHSKDADKDLVNIVEKCHGYVNIYRDFNGTVRFGNKIYATYASAELNKDTTTDKYVATTIIEWEG